ncbi:MAG: HAD family hydrolase [Paracoccaceae bacterium]
MNPELVIFDCDGVLIDSESISAQMLIQTLKDFGAIVNLAYVSKHFLGRSYPTVLKQIRAEFDIVLPKDFEDEYRTKLLENFEKNLKIMPGISDVIDQLSINFCVATSSSPVRVAKSLDLVGLLSRCEGRIFTASLVANGKPAPDLFFLAAKRMGVSPDNCLVIEDSLNGIRAGLAAGMKVWRFTGGSHISDADRKSSVSREADFAFDRFGEFFEFAPKLKQAGIS